MSGSVRKPSLCGQCQKPHRSLVVGLPGVCIDCAFVAAEVAGVMCCDPGHSKPHPLPCPGCAVECDPKRRRYVSAH